jgi:hypothetical protein
LGEYCWVSEVELKHCNKKIKFQPLESIMSKTKVANFSQMYTKYLNLVQAVRSLPSFPQLDAVESRMLNVFASAWHEDKPITVLEAMVMLPEISTTTAHRRLKALRKKGMIDLNLDSQDNRVKYVVPTKATHQYFAQLGQCMEKAQVV